MKLVELLAKELVEWPDGYRAIVQNPSGRMLPIDTRVVVFSAGQWDYHEATQEIYNAEFSSSKLATDHATAIVTREMWAAERSRSVIGQRVTGGGTHIDDPRHNRDRIREIDADFKIMAAERDRLVGELAAEGFALIAAVTEPDEDMTDWRNWKVGDLVECVKEIRSTTGISVGSIYTLTGVSRDSIEFDDDEDDWRDRGDTDNFKFHSRPSA